MKITLQIFSVLLLLAGLVFFLQGINVIPGSFMTGDPQWAINGAIAMVIGIGLFVWVNRGK
ncbi:MAG: FUSC family protein [Anaerolineae bacterium]|nr:FUSC family protein [Anaerolineae bacterium]MCI0608956.1 FUSC family protein [Anaerolineae bacterium]